jgi:pyruvate dehydrogenase E2 component (dihydrolipoamide acetyltransferase)
VGDFTMPSLGADMDAGTIVEWRVRPGDEVHRGDIVAVVETEKSTIEVEVFENGTVEQLIVPEGEHVPVGTVLARIAGGPARKGVVTRAPGPVAPVAPAAAAPVVPVAPVPFEVVSVHSPVVRHLAERLGVDLATVSGSGPAGTVTRSDVERAASEREGARRGPPVEGVEGVEGVAGRQRSSPYARRLASELGVDLATLQGTGPGGAVVERDLRRPAEGPAAGPAAARPAAEGPAAGRPAGSAEQRQAAMRRAIGSLMARSKREIPHYYLSTTIDMGAATAWLEQANLERPVTSRLVLPALLLKATALAVAKVPEMNGFYVDDAFTASTAVHVGVAISLRAGGVIAPAIHDADRLSIDELMERLRDLVQRARSGVLRSSEMSDPTITVTNLGELGVESVFGVIYPPQVALVGYGQVTERAVAHDGMVGVRPCLTATLSADHRVSDGHRGGRFLAEIDRLLQEPEHL